MTHCLVGGCYGNIYCNFFFLSADVMRSYGAQSIFAVDVGSIDNTELTNYGDTLSGWWLLWKRWNPWTEPVRVCNMSLAGARTFFFILT